MSRTDREIGRAIQAVCEAEDTSFPALIRAAGMDPKRDLRLRDWSGIDFSGCDLRGFDFSGAKLRGCRFDGALIEGARFDKADLGDARLASEDVAQEIADLSAAADWEAHIEAWRPSETPVPDFAVPNRAIFVDAPFAPKMVAIGGCDDSCEDAKPVFAKSLCFATLGEYERFWGKPRFDDPSTSHLEQRNADLFIFSPTYAQMYCDWLSDRTGLAYRVFEGDDDLEQFVQNGAGALAFDRKRRGEQKAVRTATTLLGEMKRTPEFLDFDLRLKAPHLMDDSEGGLGFRPTNNAWVNGFFDAAGCVPLLLTRERQEFGASASPRFRSIASPGKGAPAPKRRHTGDVAAIIQLADGRVATASDDHTIGLWDSGTHTPIAFLEGHENRVRGLAELRDGRLGSTSDDGTVRFWRLKDRTHTTRIFGEGGFNALLQLADGRLVTGAGDSKVQLWNAATGEESSQLIGHEHSISALISLGGDLIATASSGRTIRIWNAVSGETLSKLKLHFKPATALVALADGRLAASTRDGAVLIWEEYVWSQKSTAFRGHQCAVNTLIQLKKGAMASGGDDGALLIWDPDSRDVIAEVPLGVGIVSLCEVRPGGVIIAGLKGGALRWIDPLTFTVED